MYQIEGEITGVAPFLFNRYVDNPSGRKTDDAKIEEAHQKVYADAEGLYWPAWNLKRTISAGAKRGGIKEGRASFAGTVDSTLFVEADPRFSTSDYDMHEVMGRIPPRTGGYVLLRRPILAAGWRLSFVLKVVDDRTSAEKLRQSLVEAGHLVGMGSWRPEYGRFRVTKWTRVEVSQNAA